MGSAGASEKSPGPKLKSFRFDYDTGSGSRKRDHRVPVDDILDSMNRSVQVGQLLDYDPELESYYERHSTARKKRSIGKFFLLALFGMGAIGAWMWGGTRRLFETGWLTNNSLSMFGRIVPVWMILATFVIFFFMFAAVSRARSVKAESVLKAY